MGSGPRFARDGRQILAIHVFHNDEVHAPRLAGVLCGDDVRVHQPRGGLHHFVKSPDRLRRFQCGARKEPQGHDALQAAVLGLEDFRRPGGVELIEEHVLAVDELAGLSLQRRFEPEISSDARNGRGPGSGPRPPSAGHRRTRRRRWPAAHSTGTIPLAERSSVSCLSVSDTPGLPRKKMDFLPHPRPSFREL